MTTSRAPRILAAALVLWLGSIAAPRAAGEGNPWTIPGTLRVAITIQPQSLNPILTTTIYETDLARLCFDGLLAITQDGNPTPNLAVRVPTVANGDISADGKTIRYELGTGPFKFVRWVRGDRIEYVANDRYHLGRPRLRKIVVKIVPQDATAALEVRTHEIDWYWRAQATSFRESQGIPGIRALALEQNAHREMILNTTRPPLDDVRVRQAIALAIDRKLLVQRVAFGTAQAACGDVPPFSWAYDPTVRCAYDPAEARRRLAALGFGPAGKPLHLEIVFASGQEETQAVVIQIQAMLHAVGVETELHAYDPSMLFALASNGGILSSGKFDLDVSAFINRPDPDDSRLLTCANRAPRGFNASRYCSPEMEAAQRESLESFDRAKRKRAISRIEHLVVRDAPEIYLWWPRELHIVNSDLKSIATSSGLATQLPYQWSI